MEVLSRFIEAQESAYSGYNQALAEMKSGGKQSHWIWYIFPQIVGLGRSGMARRYAIQSVEEAKAYLEHPVLGSRLREITNIVLSYSDNADPNVFMMASIDAMKLKSCMTLFDYISPHDIFGEVLRKFYGDQKDTHTIKILEHPFV